MDRHHDPRLPGAGDLTRPDRGGPRGTPRKGTAEIRLPPRYAGAVKLGGGGRPRPPSQEAAAVVEVLGRLAAELEGAGRPGPAT